MKIHGECHCGHVRYEAEVDPAKTRICHCSDCQSFSGAPYWASTPARAEDFVMLGGEPTIYVKTADSGSRRAIAFCPTCGSSVYSTSADHPQAYVLRLGMVRERAELTPATQIWRRSAMPWCEAIGDIPGYDDQGP